MKFLYPLSVPFNFDHSRGQLLSGARHEYSRHTRRSWNMACERNARLEAGCKQVRHYVF